MCVTFIIKSTIFRENFSARNYVTVENIPLDVFLLCIYRKVSLIRLFFDAVHYILKISPEEEEEASKRNSAYINISERISVTETRFSHPNFSWSISLFSSLKKLLSLSFSFFRDVTLIDRHVHPHNIIMSINASTCIKNFPLWLKGRVEKARKNEYLFTRGIFRVTIECYFYIACSPNSTPHQSFDDSMMQIM